MLRRALVSIALLLAWVAPTASMARAQEASVEPEAPPAPTEEQLTQARTLFGEGLARADEQRWGEAVEYFRRALTIVERPSIVFNLGVALFRLGRTADARETLQRYLSIADATSEAEGIAQANQFLAQIEGAIGVLVLHVTPASARLSIDGAETTDVGADRTLRLDPGAHHVELSAERHEPLAFDVSVLPGAHAERTIDLPWVGLAPAHLDVRAPEGAAVLLDDDRIGRGPSALDVAPGEHVIRVETTPPYRASITLAPGEQRTISEADLAGGSRETIAQGDDTWIWVLTAIGGACVIGAAVGIGVWASQPSDPFAGYGGNTGVVLHALSW